MSTTIASNVTAPRPASGGARLGLWKRISFALAHAGVRFLLVCLSLKGLYRFGRVFGSIEFLLNRTRRRRFYGMLEHVLERNPTVAERRSVAREFFIQRRCDKLFYLILDCLSRDQALAQLSIDNQELLDEAVARGRGIELATAHHGPLHVAGLLLNLKGYKVAGVREPHEGAIRKYVQDRFDRLYPNLRRTRILSSQSFPRDIYRTLEEGWMIGSSMDVAHVDDANKKVEEVTIFGERRRFLSGPMWIAMRCRTPVLQVFVIPGKDFHYRFDVVEMLLDPEKVEDKAQAVRDAMHAYAANVEDYIRKTPHLISRV